MSKLPLVLAFLVITPPTVAQTKVLVAKDRVSIPAAEEYSGGLAYPTACDEQGRSYIKLVKSGPGIWPVPKLPTGTGSPRTAILVESNTRSGETPPSSAPRINRNPAVGGGSDECNRCRCQTAVSE